LEADPNVLIVDGNSEYGIRNRELINGQASS
jgi:hypothetical protein